MCGFFKRNCLGLQKFLPPTQSPLVFAARSCGDLSSWHWNPCLGGLVWGWDSSLPIYPSQILSTTHGCGTGLSRICAPPTSLDECGFFNSVVVKLNSISGGSGGLWWCWWFYISVVILKWFSEKVSLVYLCCHLDWKSHVL